MKNKPFDCVEMKRRGAAKVREELSGKSKEEVLEYWRKGTEELREEQLRLRAAQSHQEAQDNTGDTL